MAGLLSDHFDPNVRRLGVLPYPQGALSGQKGPVDWSNWVAPQFVVDAIKSMELPGRALRGENIPADDVTKMAMDTMGGGGLLSRAVPTGDVGGLLGINVFHGGPKLTKKQAEDLRTNSRKRRNWSQDRKNEFYRNREDVDKVRQYRQDNSPNRFANMDPFLTRSLEYRLEDHRLNLAKNEAAEKYGISPDDLSSVYKIDDVDLAAIKIQKKNKIIGLANNTPLWSKKFASDVAKSARVGFGVERAINRANLEAVPRQLKKEGWTVRHASKDSSGRVSSRYLVSPDGQAEIRLSDHELPFTPERAYNRELTGGPRWSDEIVLYGDESPSEIIAEIKSLLIGE